MYTVENKIIDLICDIKILKHKNRTGNNRTLYNKSISEIKNQIKKLTEKL